jgi:hypothetical protein
MKCMYIKRAMGCAHMYIVAGFSKGMNRHVRLYLFLSLAVQ